MAKIRIATACGDSVLERADQRDALLAAWAVVEYEAGQIASTFEAEDERAAIKSEAWLEFSKFLNGAKDAIEFGNIKITME